MGRYVHNKHAYPGYMKKCDECDRDAEFEVTVSSYRGWTEPVVMHLCMIHFRQ